VSITIPSVIDRDYGLGSAYERYCFYQWVGRVAKEYHVRSMLEGPLDGMSGISGVHGVGLARDGVAVTSLTVSEAQAAITRSVYANAGVTSAKVLVREDATLSGLKKHDMVISYHAAEFVSDWAAYLASLAALAAKVVLVTIRNPDNWTVRLLQAGARLRGSRSLDPPKEWSTHSLAPILWSLGSVKAHKYFDCPWWPDLQLGPGQGLGNRVRSMLRGEVKTAYAAAGAAKAEKHVYTPERWPYFGGPGWHEELLPALLLHPGFDGSPEFICRRAAHLHGFVVDVAPRTPQARRRVNLSL
jgi:hypothetical protein